MCDDAAVSVSCSHPPVPYIMTAEAPWIEIKDGQVVDFVVVAWSIHIIYSKYVSQAGGARAGVGVGWGHGWEWGGGACDVCLGVFEQGKGAVSSSRSRSSIETKKQWELTAASRGHHDKNDP